MSQDIVSDVLNEIMNAKKAGKTSIIFKKSSKLLIKLLEIMKVYGYIDYEIKENRILVNMKDITECKTIKPRYSVDKKSIEKYVWRFLPARNFGYVIISTSKGLMTHREAQENKIGGSLIAYFY
jgi:small subunit ribosomal protein S15Ae